MSLRPHKGERLPSRDGGRGALEWTVAHAASDSQTGCDSRQNGDYRLNDEFPSFLFHNFSRLVVWGIKKNRKNPFIQFETLSLMSCLCSFPCKRAYRQKPTFTPSFLRNHNLNKRKTSKTFVAKILYSRQEISFLGFSWMCCKPLGCLWVSGKGMVKLV